jgi:hypothetical protein
MDHCSQESVVRANILIVQEVSWPVRESAYLSRSMIAPRLAAGGEW